MSSISMKPALVAPCSFKGSLTSREAAQALSKGLRQGWPGLSTQLLPLADGGEGTLDVLREQLGGKILKLSTCDPLGRPIEGRLGVFQRGKIIFVEAAEALGWNRLSQKERDPLMTSSRGLGELLEHALAQKPAQIWIGLGGTTTVDGGAGLLEALGAKLETSNGGPISPGGAGLLRLAKISLSPARQKIAGFKLVVLCDVSAPLLGPRGARLYMPQKGAPESVCDGLEAGLKSLAGKMESTTGRSLINLPGAGAGGGLGAALAALGGELISGSSRIFRLLKLEEKLKACSFVVTGEGSYDAQSAQGKALGKLERLAHRHKKPLVVLCGSRSADGGTPEKQGLSSVFSIQPGPVSLEQACQTTARDLRQAAFQASRMLRIGRSFASI